MHSHMGGYQEGKPEKNAGGGEGRGRSDSGQKEDTRPGAVTAPPFLPTPCCPPSSGSSLPQQSLPH